MTKDELMALAMKAAEAELAWDIASSKHPDDKAVHGVDEARAALEAALEEVCKDAERYRKLCEFKQWTDELDAAFDCSSKLIIDAAIDAAMKETK